MALETSRNPGACGVSGIDVFRQRVAVLVRRKVRPACLSPLMMGLAVYQISFRCPEHQSSSSQPLSRHRLSSVKTVTTAAATWPGATGIRTLVLGRTHFGAVGAKTTVSVFGRSFYLFFLEVGNKLAGGGLPSVVRRATRDRPRQIITTRRSPSDLKVGPLVTETPATITGTPPMTNHGDHEHADKIPKTSPESPMSRLRRPPASLSQPWIRPRKNLQEPCPQHFNSA